MAKKGFQGGIKKLEKSGQCRREVQYVKGLLKLRKEQAKEDWESARVEYRKDEENLRKMCQNGSQVYSFKREMKRISDHNNKVYEYG